MTFGLGGLGVVLVLGVIVTIMLGALKKLDVDVKSKFEHGGYEFEAEGEFEIDKLGDKPKHRRKRKSRKSDEMGPEPDIENQPDQLSLERPMLVPRDVYPYPYDYFPYYNRFILV